MAVLKIDADALFRAVTASGFKLLAYDLNLDTGEIGSHTLLPGEVAAVPDGPSVQPLPKLGGDLSPKKDALPFGPPPAVENKKKLFAGDDAPKKPAFSGDFWKKDESAKKDLFGSDGFKRENSVKKLAEIFGPASAKKPADPFAHAEARVPAAPAPPAQPAQAGGAALPHAPAGPRRPRIPVASEAEQAEWVRAFARGFGDPKIRDEMLEALKNAKPLAAFERVLRKHQRMSQQWDHYFRKTALAKAEAWLSALGLQWELVENH